VTGVLKEYFEQNGSFKIFLVVWGVRVQALAVREATCKVTS